MLDIFKRKKPILIVDMSPEHLQQCADIHCQSFSRGWSDGVLREMLAGRGMYGLVAKRTGGPREAILAFIIYRMVARECEIITVTTAGEHRGKGAARALINEMIRHCLTDRLEEIFLEVDEGNQAAIRLYRSFGFKPVGKRSAYYKSGMAEAPDSEIGGNDLANEKAAAHDAVIMKLDLRDSGP